MASFKVMSERVIQGNYNVSYFPSTVLQLLDTDHDGYLSLEEMYHIFFNEGQEKLTEDDRIEVCTFFLISFSIDNKYDNT